MTITEFIEKHEPNLGERFALKEFAIELLEKVKCESKKTDTFCGIVIDKALAELKEKT